MYAPNNQDSIYGNNNQDQQLSIIEKYFANDWQMFVVLE
jgi:hypothetical protein